MIVRILETAEIPNAAGLSRYVFDACLRNRMEFVQTIAFVEEYLKEEHLMELVREGKLVLWGAFDENSLTAVAGLQPDGWITMLYVLPQCANRGCGSALLASMREYAKTVYGLQQISVNATPAWTAAYFAKQGFAYEHQDMHVPFLPMHAQTGSNPMFEKKYVPAKVMVFAALACLVFATITCALYLIGYQG